MKSCSADLTWYVWLVLVLGWLACNVLVGVVIGRTFLKYVFLFPIVNSSSIRSCSAENDDRHLQEEGGETPSP
jgi:hypothetical protein